MAGRGAEILRDYSSRVRESDLLAKLCILMLCLIYALPNIWAVRTMYYFVVLPVAALTLARQDVKDVASSPLFVALTVYFVIFAMVAPFAPTFAAAHFIEHVRSSLLVLSFLVIVVNLVRRDSEFPYELFVYLSIVAAVVAVRNIFEFYGGLPPLDRIPVQMQGVKQVTIYYNSNWVAAMYGIACVGAAATAIRPDRSRALVALLTVAAIVLFVALLLTQSRSVLLGVLIALGIVLFTAPYRLRLPSRRAIQIGLVLVAILMVMPFVQSFVSRGDSNRVLIWQAYVDFVQASPWVGHGLKTELPLEMGPNFRTNHPHNIVYNALLRGGVFAAICVFVVLVLIGLQAIRAWRTTGAALIPALVVCSILPLQLEFTVVVGTSVGWDWLTLWLPIALCIGATMERTS